MAEKTKIRPLFLKYFRKYYKYWGWGLLATVGATSFAVLGPLILRDTIDDLQSGQALKVVIMDALLIVGVTAVSGIFRYFMRQSMIVASRKVEYDIRNDFFSHLETLDRSFFEETPVGDIMSRATNDLEAVRAMYGPALMHSISTVFTVTFAFISMYRIDPVLTAYSSIPLPLLSVTVVILGRMVYKRYAKIQEHYGKISAFVQENLSGIRVVHSFVQERNQIKQFEILNKEYIRKNLNMVKVWGMFFPILSMIGGGLMVMILLVGGQRVIDGEITLGTFVAFTAYLLMLVWPMIALGWVIGLFQKGSASMARIKRIFDREPIIKSPDNPAELVSIKGDIEFRNLDFSYNNSSGRILKGISFQAKAGQTVAIVGATGSGKTTLVSLLARLYPVSNGQVFVDGVDINRIDLQLLRSQIGFVPQGSFLFSESLTANVAFGAGGDSTAEAVKDAVCAADLQKDIETFPSGLDTVIGEKGITLSGGQKQRASIARAIIKRPPILIFDDAFSSVDTHTEETILQNLRRVTRESLVFLISHRISTVKNADLIVVLDKGELAEIGDHNTLLAHKGVYARIHKRQLIVEELEAF